jgi:hypothetical protein
VAGVKEGGPLCMADVETSVFDCTVKGGKHVSLCLSPELTGDTGYIVYRFGTASAVELEVMERRGDGERRFLYTFESPTNYSSTRMISFANEGVNYAVLDEWGGTSGQDQQHVGSVEVDPPSGAPVSISCVSEPQSTLHVGGSDAFFPG